MDKKRVPASSYGEARLFAHYDLQGVGESDCLFLTTRFSTGFGPPPFRWVISKFGRPTEKRLVSSLMWVRVRGSIVDLWLRSGVKALTGSDIQKLLFFGSIPTVYEGSLLLNVKY